MANEPHVVIVGGGFGGLHAARALRRAPVRVTLLDRNNYHLFQPLLYQVATAGLSPADIAAPLRRVFRRDQHVRVVLGEAVGVDLKRRRVIVTEPGDAAERDGASRGEVAYDSLILAAGVDPAYFGNNAWRAHAPGLKDIADATEMRRRILLAFEAAELEADEAARRSKLTFVIAGGGPTGIELAGALSEMARRSLPKDFRNVDTRATRVILVEMQDTLLPGLDPQLGAWALRDLEAMGVEVRLGTRVLDIDGEGVVVGDPERRIEARNVFWAAGVTGPPLARTLGIELGRGGRVPVNSDLSLPGHPEVFVIGDMAAVVDAKGKPVPGVAPAAMQMGRFVGSVIAREAGVGMRAENRPSFVYRNKGDLATIGRARAVADVFGSKFHGSAAWLMWLFVHILFLIGYGNRLVVLVRWAWAYITFQQGARIIVGDKTMGVRTVARGEDISSRDDEV